MRFSLGTHGRLITPTRTAAPALLTGLLLLALAGCGGHKAEQSPSASGSQNSSSSSSEAIVANSPAPGGATGGSTDEAIRTAELMRAAANHQVTLTDHRCVRFEPQWTSVHVGQTITWRSELRKPVRIYVSPGVFDRLSFLVRPGATVTSGPVRESGQFSFWTEPCACREAPRGVLMAGPGVNVHETFYAAAPGVH